MSKRIDKWIEESVKAANKGAKELDNGQFETLEELEQKLTKQEQWQKILEWCGFRKELIPRKSVPGTFWATEMLLRYPDGGAVRVCMDDYPDPDLNSFRKYVIPKLQEKGYWIHIDCWAHKGFRVAGGSSIDYLVFSAVEGDSLEDALLEACYEVVK